MKLHNWFRGLTIGIVLLATCIHTALAQVDSAACSSLTDSLLLGAGSLPDMAADPLGYIHVVWADSTLGVMYEQVGPDGTITVPPTSVYPGAGYSIPHIAVDSYGNAHVVAGLSVGQILYLKISGGKQVAISVFLINTDGNPDQADYSPCIAIDPTTQLPVVAAEIHTDYYNFFYGLYVYSTYIASVSLDGGGNPVPGSVFEAWYDMETPDYLFNAVSYPSVAVDNNGVTHAVWEYQDPDLSGLTVGYANSGSSYWEEIANTANISGFVGRPIIIRGADGNLDVVWSNSGHSVVWTQINPQGVITIDNSIVSQPAAIPSWPTLASASGQLVCSWTDGRNGANSQIFARSLLSTVPECDVSESPGAASFGAVAINSSGSAAYVWQDQRSGSSQLWYRSTVPTFVVVDANPQFLNGTLLPQPITSTLLTSLQSASTTRNVAAADGITKLLLMVTTPSSGNVIFSQSGGNSGTFTNVDGTPIQAAGVSTVAVGGQQVAFALYTVPDQTSPGGANVNLNASFFAQGASTPVPFTPWPLELIQTPVVLVHGLWDKGEVWANMQYYLSTLNINAQLVKYWDPDNKASGPFISYLGTVTEQIKSMLNEMRASVPGSQTGAAVTVADVVAHSMGGILTRQDANNQDSHTPENYNSGYIRRIITVDTPYWGATPAPVLRLLAADSPAYNLALSLNNPVDKGGVQDLSPTSFAVNSGGASSFVYKALANPCCAISCYVNQDSDFSGDVTHLYFLTEWVAGLINGSQQDQLQANLCGRVLTSATDQLSFANDIFDYNSNDGIVALSSQNGGYTGPPSTFPGIEHTTAPSNPSIGSYIVGLLQGPVSAFGNGLPVVTEADLISQVCVNAAIAKQSQHKKSPKDQQSLMLLTAPTNGCTFASGSSIALMVQPLTNVSLVGVVFISSDNSPAYNQNPILDIITNAPFNDVVNAPTNFFGPLTIAAIGLDNQGNYDVKQTTIEILPSTNLTLESISANFNSFGTNLVFKELGVTQGLTVIGTYSDGFMRDISLGGSGTAYSTSNAGVAVVDTNGNITAVGNGSAQIVVTNSGKFVLIPVQVMLQAPEIISIYPNSLEAGITNASIIITGSCLGGTTNVTFLRDGYPETNVNVGSFTFGANSANIQTEISVANNVSPGLLTLVATTPIGNSGQTAVQGNRFFIGQPLVINYVGISNAIGGGGLGFTIVGGTGSGCIIQTSTDLLTWVNESTNILTFGSYRFTETNTPNLSEQRFYRVQQQ